MYQESRDSVLPVLVHRVAGKTTPFLIRRFLSRVDRLNEVPSQSGCCVSSLAEQRTGSPPLL